MLDSSVNDIIQPDHEKNYQNLYQFLGDANKTLNIHIYLYIYLKKSLVAIVFLLHYRTFQNKCRN